MRRTDLGLLLEWVPTGQSHLDTDLSDAVAEIEALRKVEAAARRLLGREWGMYEGRLTAVARGDAFLDLEALRAALPPLEEP